MKRQKFAPGAALVLCGVVCAAANFSCSMEIPQSVTVKTNAGFGVPLGDTEFRIADKVNAEKMQDAMSGGSSLTVYEYNPSGSDSAALEFVMDYPVDNSNLQSGGQSLEEILNSPSTGATGTVNLDPVVGYVDTGLNFTEMLKSFGSDDDGDGEDKKDYGYIFDKIKFRGVKAYAYIDADDGFSFTGDIYVTTNPAAGGEGYEVSADASKRTAASETFPVKKAPDFAGISGEDKVVKQDLFGSSDKYSAELNSSVVEEMVNSRGDKFTLVYRLVPTIALNAERLAALKAKGSVSFSVNIVIRFPLTVDVTDDVLIDDVLDLAGHALDEDLFNRDSADDDKISKLAGLFEDGGMTLSYKFSDTTGLSFDSRIVAKDSAGTRYVDEQVVFQGGRTLAEAAERKVELTAEETRRIFRSYPFQPQIELVVKKTASPVSIRRDSTFGTWATFDLRTGGQYTVWEK